MMFKRLIMDEFLKGKKKQTFFKAKGQTESVGLVYWIKKYIN